MHAGSTPGKSATRVNTSKISLFRYLKSSILCGLGYSIPYSLFLYYVLSLIVGMPVLFNDALILQGYILAFSMVTFTVLSLLLWIPVTCIHTFLRKKTAFREPAVMYMIAFSVPVFVSIFLTVWILSSRPFDFRNPLLLPILILFCLAGLIIGCGLKSIALRVRKIFNALSGLRKIRFFLLLLCLSLVVSAIAFFTSEMVSARKIEQASTGASARINTNTKLIIIGLDGATWDVMEALIERGELPNIKFLMDNGSYGPLLSNISMLKAFKNSAAMGMRSPALWETMFTGKSERKHGIFDFAVMRLPLMTSVLPFRLPVVEDFLETIPTTSTVKKSLRNWEILSSSGLDVGIVGLWTLWPVQPVERGFIVSSRIQWGSERAVYPPDLLQGYPGDSVFTNEKAISLFLNPWEDLSRDSLISILAASAARENFASFRHHFKRDNYMAALSVFLLENHPSSFFATYFWGPDFASHLFWKYMEPAGFDDVTEDDARLFGEIIPRYYVFLDEVIGKHIEVNSLNATYLIISDHGFGAWEEEGSSELDRPGSSYSGKHRRNGIIIVSGEHIKKGVDLRTATIFDITPTVLTLLGMPVSLDMDGRPLTEILDEGFLEEYPLRYVNTYETGKKRVPVAVSSEVDIEIKERLKALGYIK